MKNREENVFSIFSKSPGVKEKQQDPSYDVDKHVFEDAIRKNLEIRSRLQKERSKNNSSVLRSYRITKK
ncbi:MAG: hypothetical protein AB8C84_09005 [Oligoflexales bacterium]